MGTSVEPNMAEVTRDEMIKAEAAKIKAKEDAEILAEAARIVDAEIAVRAEAAKLKAEEERDAKIRAEEAKAKAVYIKAFANGIAKYMIENQIDNPRYLTSVQFDEIRSKAGV